MQSLALGPFALSMDHLLLLIALVIALFAGWISSRKGGKNPESALFLIVLVAALGARLGFVLRYSEEYLADPVQIIDIRDGGFWWVSGLAAGIATTLFCFWRQPALRRPLGIALLCGGITWGTTAVPLAHIQQNQQSLPDMVLMSQQGQEVNLQDYAGKPVVLNVWATWCPPCVREMPVLQEAQQSHPEVHFLFANLGEDTVTIDAFLMELGVELDNVLLDQRNAIGQHYGSRALPTTLFIDAQGQLRDSHLGELSAASLKDKLGRLLPDQLPQ